MKFPIESAIVPVSYGPLGEGVTIVIDGNTGNIPIGLMCFIKSKDGAVIQSKNVQMTDSQWEAWTTQNDKSYLLACGAELMGVTLQ